MLVSSLKRPQTTNEAFSVTQPICAHPRFTSHLDVCALAHSLQHACLRHDNNMPITPADNHSTTNSLPLFLRFVHLHPLQHSNRFEAGILPLSCLFRGVCSPHLQVGVLASFIQLHLSGHARLLMLLIRPSSFALRSKTIFPFRIRWGCLTKAGAANNSTPALALSK